MPIGVLFSFLTGQHYRDANVEQPREEALVDSHRRGRQASIVAAVFVGSLAGEAFCLPPLHRPPSTELSHLTERVKANQ